MPVVRDGPTSPRLLNRRSAGTRPSALRSKAQRDRAPRANHRVKQATRGNSLAEFEPVRNQARNAEIVRQRPHYMVEPLADEHHILRALFRHAGAQAFNALRLQLLFQDVFEIFLA